MLGKVLAYDPDEMLPASKYMDTTKQQFPRRWIKASLLGLNVSGDLLAVLCNGNVCFVDSDTDALKLQGAENDMLTDHSK